MGRRLAWLTERRQAVRFRGRLRHIRSGGDPLQPRVYYAKACGIIEFGDSPVGVTKEYPTPRFVAMYL